MRICIYGAGAMGVSFGALLQQTMSVPIDFVTRNVLRVKALNERGAELISGNTKVVVPVRAILPEQMSGAYDIVFLATKQRGNTQTAQFLKQYVADDGALVTLQNGFPEPELADIIGPFLDPPVVEDEPGTQNNVTKATKNHAREIKKSGMIF